MSQPTGLAKHSPAQMAISKRRSSPIHLDAEKTRKRHRIEKRRPIIKSCLELTNSSGKLQRKKRKEKKKQMTVSDRDLETNPDKTLLDEAQFHFPATDRAISDRQKKTDSQSQTPTQCCQCCTSGSAVEGGSHFRENNSGYP